MQNEISPTELIEHYQDLLRTEGLADEGYKWELLRIPRSRPDLNAPNFGEEVLKMDFSNLMHGRTSLASLLDIAKNAPEDFRQLLIQLFDEHIPLNERLATYKQDANAAFAKT